MIDLKAPTIEGKAGSQDGLSPGVRRLIMGPPNV